MKMSPRNVWTAVVGLSTAAELIAMRKGRADATLSAATRAVFRTETKLGRGAFMAGWGWLMIWYAVHIIRYKEQ